MAYKTQFRVATRHDHSRLLDSDEFMGLLAMAHSNHLDVVDYYQRLKSVIEKAIARIEFQ